jgi:hypothetical protein
LLTRYTAFIAIDDMVRKADGLESEKVKQPLPLPKNVPNSAVGGRVDPGTNHAAAVARWRIVSVISAQPP